jgi:CBS domain-containing membrane protein
VEANAAPDLEYFLEPRRPASESMNDHSNSTRAGIHGGLLARWVTHLKAGFWPARLHVDARERWRALLGSGCGILFTAALCRWWAGADLASYPWLMAPIGASAVLIFAVPASPLAQPWAVIGGTTLSALVGVLCAQAVADPVMAGAAAVALAIGLMFLLRCLHPPGGAAALLAATTGVGLHFLVFPVLANCVLLVLAGVVYNSLTGRRYPHRPVALSRDSRDSGAPPRFTAADLDAALAHYNQVLDISRDDLGELLHQAESAAYQRRFGDLKCGDIMSTEPAHVQFGTPLAEAWRLMREHAVKALPVTDRVRRIVGIVTMADFLRHSGLEVHEGIGKRLLGFLQPSGRVHSDKPEVVGQIMSREVRVVSVGRHASELIALFSEAGHHHIPVIDEERHLVGIITPTNLVRTLYRMPR